jgi:hypothetical protein
MPLVLTFRMMTLCHSVVLLNQRTCASESINELNDCYSKCCSDRDLHTRLYLGVTVPDNFYRHSDYCMNTHHGSTSNV